ncbi:unnamed protein product [Urochloa humidicola]
MMAERWQRSLAPAVPAVVAAAQNMRRENSLDNGSPIYGTGQKVNSEKTRPYRATATAAMGGSVARIGSLKSANSTIVKRRMNENEGCRRPYARRHGGAGAPDHRKPVALLQETRRSVVASRSRLGVMSAAAACKSSSITSGGHQHGSLVVAAAVVKVAGPEAFPSTRYDAMLLREDPRNLTWLRGCDEDNDDGCTLVLRGIDLVDSSLELFDMG